MSRELTIADETPRDLAVRLAPRTRRQAGLWGDALRRLRHDRAAVVGMAIIVILAVVAALAPALVPTSPTDQSFIDKFTPPGREHLMGTDEFGRDTLSRVIYGSRVALWVGLAPVAIALVVGVTAGLAAGYYGGPLDQIVMRIVDIILAFPWLLLAIGIMAILGPGINNVIIAVAIIYVPSFARIVRSSVLSIKEKSMSRRLAPRASPIFGLSLAMSLPMPGRRSSSWQRSRSVRGLSTLLGSASSASELSLLMLIGGSC